MRAAASVPVDLRGFRSALVIKPSSLGDIVHALPAVRLVKRAHPHLFIRWVANTEWLPLIEGCSFVDEAIGFPRKSFRGAAGKARSLAWLARWNKLPRQMPEIALDLQGLLRSGILSFSRGSDCVIGLSDSREGASRFHDHVVAVDPAAHAVERCLAMVRALGIGFSAEDVVFELPEGCQPEGFDSSQPFVLLHPHARGQGKALGAAALQTLCDCLAGARLVLVGMAADPAAPQRPGIVDLTNRTSLPELVWLMRNARACVSSDSGPLHIAAAVNDRTLGLHTWSDPCRVGPWNPRAWVWKAGRIAHRTEFSESERASRRIIEEPDARRIADFILGSLAA